jgi:hypothetical protein
MSGRVFGVRALQPEPDRRAILRLADHPAEGILLYRNFKESPSIRQVSSGPFRARESLTPK